MGIAFNSAFVKMAELKDKRFVSFKVDLTAFRIGIRFHNNHDDPTALTLSQDGGGKGHALRERNNLAVVTGALMAGNKWVKAVATQKDLNLRQFEPEWESREKLWVIKLRPSFERHVEKVEDIPAGVVGIYRYVFGQDIIYIGKGNVRSRAQSPDRSDWKWDKIQYSIIDNEPQQYEWEKWWLDSFEKSNGRLPEHNRVGGRHA